jgi:hypothetical protein
MNGGLVEPWPAQALGTIRTLKHLWKKSAIALRQDLYDNINAAIDSSCQKQGAWQLACSAMQEGSVVVG